MHTCIGDLLKKILGQKFSVWSFLTTDLLSRIIIKTVASDREEEDESKNCSEYLLFQVLALLHVAVVKHVVEDLSRIH